jgi:hypothetical protein
VVSVVFKARKITHSYETCQVLMSNTRGNPNLEGAWCCPPCQGGARATRLPRLSGTSFSVKGCPPSAVTTDTRAKEARAPQRIRPMVVNDMETITLPRSKCERQPLYPWCLDVYCEECKTFRCALEGIKARQVLDYRLSYSYVRS